ncbi:MAG: hypothetical protein JKY43_10985 [Phycisphaerales bacterium]|nr:hypothetical protein [Phycisphaerales bacterium]
MSKIVNVIQKRAFEIIRDRIGEILIDELANQVAISYNEDIDATVFVERSVPFQAVELPCVNVSVTRGGFDNATIVNKDGTYTYNIDCWTRAKTTNDNGGDSLAMFKLQRLAGVLDAILSDHQYNTLGFVKPYISSTFVEELAIAEPKRNEDAESVMMGRLTFVVRVCEGVEKLEANLIDGFDTSVKIGNTDQGYIYSGNNTPVPPPVNPGGTVFNSLNVEIGVAPSGGFFVVPDSNISNSDDSFSVDLPATENLELPDTIYEIYVDGVLDQSFTVPALTDQIININA